MNKFKVLRHFDLNGETTVVGTEVELTDAQATEFADFIGAIPSVEAPVEEAADVEAPVEAPVEEATDVEAPVEDESDEDEGDVA